MLKRAVGEQSTWPYVAFQVLLVVLITFLWLSDILPATIEGTTSQSIVEAGLPVNVIYFLDLGVIVLAFALSSYWLYKRRPWGYAFTVVLLVKIAALGGAVLAMAYFMINDGKRFPSLR
ncbi:hypothetical protein [Halogranum rubrum]|uniref:hypothetical protein n=1 Tax=Halogranum rubrum TaxID=553466 RepID=UPI000B7E1B34|nr:hypothetical protein [Halogranum rubrum]